MQNVENDQAYIISDIFSQNFIILQNIIDKYTTYQTLLNIIHL